MARCDGDYFYTMALVAIGEASFDQAVEAFQRAADCGHARAAFELGMLFEHHGDLTSATAAYRRAEALADPARTALRNMPSELELS